jgi:hypothetical protein
MKTLIIISDQQYVVPCSYDTVLNRLGDVEESWVDMMRDQGDFSIIDNVNDEVTHTVDEIVSIIDIATTSSQMDGWDPDEEE